MTAIAIRALDVTVRLDVPEVAGALVAEALVDLIDDDPDRSARHEIVWTELGHAEAGGRWRVERPAGEIDAQDISEALSHSLIEINRLAAASAAPDHTLLHAGAFGHDGGAIAVTGTTGAGKSTLVAAAVLAGHGYLADEVCALDRNGHVVRPYHRPIGLRSGGAAAIGVPIPPHPLRPYADVYPWPVSGHAHLAGPTPLGLVAFVHRRPGPVEIVPVRPADALVRLTSLSLATEGLERVMFRRLEQLVRDVRLVTVAYEDLASAVEALCEVLA